MSQFKENYQKLLDELSPDKETTLLRIVDQQKFSIGWDFDIKFTQNVKVAHEGEKALAVHHDPGVIVYLTILGKQVELYREVRDEPIVQVIGEPMITAISLIAVSLVLLAASVFFFVLSIIARSSAGMCVCSLLMAGLAIMSIVDAVHFVIYGTSLGSVQY